MMPTRCPVVNHRHAADVKPLHHLKRFAHQPIGSNRDRIDDHARLRSLYFVDFLGLPFNAQVFVNYSDSALLRERDGERRFGDSVHCRRAERNLQTDVARELSCGVSLVREDIRTIGY